MRGIDPTECVCLLLICGAMVAGAFLDHAGLAFVVGFPAAIYLVRHMFSRPS